ncbi:MAG: ABC transporter permease [Natronosporangium sp.]
MNPTATSTVLRAGFAQGRIELRQSFTGAELLSNLLWPVATLVALFFLRERGVAGSDLTLSTLALPGVLGMFTSFGLLLVIQSLAADREDGSLLRAKAIPNGVRGYLTGKLVTVSGTILAYLVILLVPGLLLVGGLELDGLRSWLTLGWVLLLGLVATQSVGAIIGSLVGSSRGAGILALPVIGLIAISGIFYPVTALPEWLQWIAQAFPVYWLGLGMRSALLPDGAASVEIGESWRQLETFAMLGAWAALGLMLAPIVLRRMARRESGAGVAERREKLLRRVG